MAISLNPTDYFEVNLGEEKVQQKWYKIYVFDKKNNKILVDGENAITDNIQKIKDKFIKKVIISDDNLEISDIYVREERVY